jgi:hypothetical protein
MCLLGDAVGLYVSAYRFSVACGTLYLLENDLDVILGCFLFTHTCLGRFSTEQPISIYVHFGAFILLGVAVPHTEQFRCCLPLFSAWVCASSCSTLLGSTYYRYTFSFCLF